MNSGTLNCRSEFCQNCRSHWQTVLEHQRLARLFGREKRERDFWEAAFLWPEACPEGCVDNHFNRALIRRMIQFFLATPACFRQMLSKVCFDSRGYGAGCLVGWFPGHAEF